MWKLKVLVAAATPMLAAAQEACFTASDIAGSVLGTFFSTLAAIAVGILLYWFFCRKKRAKAAVTRPTDEEIERHAYTNPYFQDDELEKAPTEENGKPGIDNGSTKLSIVSDKKASAKGNKKTKANNRNNPFSVFGNNKGHPQRALDDSCIHQEPERIEVNLRGSDFTGLGFNICGNIRDGIYVRDVLHRGPAGESGKIKAGDRIMNVTVSFDKITIEDALTILSYASPYDVSLDVQKTSDHPGSFLPGHQKKGSMDSSTSATMGTAGERLSHPIYRSQSSDDVSHLSREGGSNSKRSIGIGVQAGRLKKESSTGRPMASSVQEEPNVEGSAESNQKSRIKIDKLGNAEGEVQVVVHKEQMNSEVVQNVSASQPKIADGKKKEESLVKKHATAVEPLKHLNDEIDGVVKEIFNPGQPELVQPKPEIVKKSTNPFDVGVRLEGSESSKNDDENTNATHTNHFPDIGNMQSLSSMLDNFMKDVKESIETDGQTTSTSNATVTFSPDTKSENKASDNETVSKTEDNLPEFNITIPSLDLGDLQATFQSSLQNVNGTSAEVANQVKDGSENVSEAIQDTAGALQSKWTTGKQNTVDSIKNKVTDAEAEIQATTAKVSEESKALQNNIKLEMNAAADTVLGGLMLASGNDPKSMESDEITPDSLEMPGEQNQSSISSVDSGTKSLEMQNGASHTSKIVTPQTVFDPDLNENIQYFENKMQAALQKSPKVKSKRSAVPGKRKAPQPPASPTSSQIQQQLQPDSAVSEEIPKTGNPFVVGLKPMSKPTEVESSKGENVVFLKSNNVTTVKVNTANPAIAVVTDVNGTKENSVATEDKKSASSRKISSKTDGNFSFGFLRTNFFEGLDKAGNEDASKGDVNRFNSIPRSCTAMQCPINGECNIDRRSSSLGDLTKIRETNSKSPVLERAVSMDLKEVDQVTGAQLGEIKMHVDVDTSSAKDSSDEVSLSKGEVENGIANDKLMETDDHNHQGDLEDWIDEKVADKQNNKYKLIQGLFKKEKGMKRKKKDEPNKIAEITLPVSNTMVISTATINLDQNNHDEIIEKSMNLSPESEMEQEIFPNCKVTMIEAKEELKRQTSLSSSSLSEDSIDEERTFKIPPKRRMVAVDANVNYEYDSDSDDETISPQSPTPTGSNNSGNLNNDNYQSPKLLVGNVSIPIIPPIISSRDLRSPSLPSKDDDQQASNHDELNRPLGQVRSLSPTKFPNIRSEERRHLQGENGDNHVEDHNENADGVGTNHFGYSYQTTSNSTNDTSTVTTMHVTVTNTITPQSKNAMEIADSFTAYPIASQGAISKTLIISNPQLTLSMDTTKNEAEAESPPPNLEPPQ